MKIRSCFSFLLVFLSINYSYGSSIVGGGITYEHVPGTVRDYSVKLTLYQDVSKANLNPTQSLSYTSSCHPGGTLTASLLNSSIRGTPIQATFNCASQSQAGTLNIAKWVYELTVTLPMNCFDWNFYWTDSTRDSSITNIVNPGAHGILIKSWLNNNLGQNSSPILISEPFRQFCANSLCPLSIYQSVIEPDGDSLTFSLGEPMDGPYPGSVIPWANGYTTNDPITGTSGLNFNSTTGTFILMASNPGQIIYKGIIKEYRFSQLTLSWHPIGQISREMIFPIVNNCDSLASTWSLNLKGSKPKELEVACNSNIVEFESTMPIACNTLGSDGSDFSIFRSNGNPVPIVSVSSIGCSSGFFTKFKVNLGANLVQNDSLFLVSKIGSDTNTLGNYCGYKLPEGDSILLIVKSCPNIGTQELELDFDIYPNPLDDFLEIRFTVNSTNRVHLFNMKGQLLYEKSGKGDLLSLDLGHLLPGIYVLEIINGQKIQRQKIIKN